MKNLLKKLVEEAYGEVVNIYEISENASRRACA